MVYFFPCSIQPGTTQKVHKFLTYRRSIIYFLHRKIMQRYSQRSINDIDSICKVDNTYAWSMIG